MAGLFLTDHELRIILILLYSVQNHWIQRLNIAYLIYQCFSCVSGRSGHSSRAQNTALSVKYLQRDSSWNYYSPTLHHILWSFATGLTSLKIYRTPNTLYSIETNIQNCHIRNINEKLLVTFQNDWRRIQNGLQVPRKCKTAYRIDRLPSVVSRSQDKPRITIDRIRGEKTVPYRHKITDSWELQSYCRFFIFARRIFQTFAT